MTVLHTLMFSMVHAAFRLQDAVSAEQFSGSSYNQSNEDKLRREQALQLLPTCSCSSAAFAWLAAVSAARASSATRWPSASTRCAESALDLHKAGNMALGICFALKCARLSVDHAEPSGALPPMLCKLLNCPKLPTPARRRTEHPQPTWSH